MLTQTKNPPNAGAGFEGQRISMAPAIEALRAPRTFYKLAFIFT